MHSFTPICLGSICYDVPGLKLDTGEHVMEDTDVCVSGVFASAHVCAGLGSLVFG